MVKRQMTTVCMLRILQSVIQTPKMQHEFCVFTWKRSQWQCDELISDVASQEDDVEHRGKHPRFSEQTKQLELEQFLKSKDIIVGYTDDYTEKARGEGLFDFCLPFSRIYQHFAVVFHWFR